MPVKITLIDALQRVLPACQALPDNLHTKVSYHFGRITVFLEHEQKQYLQAREKKAASLLPSNGKGGWDLKGDNVGQFNEEHAALLNMEIEVPFMAIPAVDVLRLEGGKYALEDESKRPSISPACLAALDPFLTHDGE